MKKVAILGASGSIGTSAIEVIKHHKDKLELVAVSVYEHTDCLVEILKEFDTIEVVSLKNLNDVSFLIQQYPNIHFYEINEGIEKIIQSSAEIVLNAIVGFAGLNPTLLAIKNHKDVALANKESLVIAGEFIMREAKRNHVKIIPVDSEHSAIYQCLEKNNPVKKIILTASGGPFFRKSLKELQNVSVEAALAHPTWKMGKKISIDSASMFNKAFEIIEASYLFHLKGEQIEVLVHPQSIVHSLVEFKDGAIKAQLGVSDMKVPISFALTNKKRLDDIAKSLSLVKEHDLQFYEVEGFLSKPLKLAYQVLKKKGTYPCVLNAANEEAVNLFLNHKIKFTEIYDLVEEVLNAHKCINKKITINEVILADEWARKYIRRKFI